MSLRGKFISVNSAFACLAWFAVHLIRPPATFSPSDAEKELFCGTISRRRCLRTAHQRTNTGLISFTPTAYLNSPSPPGTGSLSKIFWMTVRWFFTRPRLRRCWPRGGATHPCLSARVERFPQFRGGAKTGFAQEVEGGRKFDQSSLSRVAQ